MPSNKTTAQTAAEATEHVAAEATATDVEMATIEFRGVTITVPRSVDDWPAECLEMMELGVNARLMRMLLGAEAMQEVYATGATIGDLRELGDLIDNATDMPSGN